MVRVIRTLADSPNSNVRHSSVDNLELVLDNRRPNHPEELECYSFCIGLILVTFFIDASVESPTVDTHATSLKFATISPSDHKTACTSMLLSLKKVRCLGCFRYWLDTTQPRHVRDRARNHVLVKMMITPLQQITRDVTSESANVKRMFCSSIYGVWLISVTANGLTSIPSGT